MTGTFANANANGHHIQVHENEEASSRQEQSKEI